MKHKILFLLLIAAAATVIFGCVRNGSPKSQAKVDSKAAESAIQTARKVIDAAQNKKDREFAGLSADFKKNRSGLYECYLLLQNVRPAADAKWKVREDRNNGTVNVSCPLDKKRDLLIVLQPQPDKSLKFTFACTLNS